MIQPRLAWELARKDLALFAADRRGMLLCFAVPVLLATAFGAVFHRPADGPVARPRVWVVNEDLHPHADRVVTELLQSERLQASECDRHAARRRLAAEGAGVALVLPPGFGDGLRLGRRGPRPNVELWHHPTAEVEARYAEGLFTEAALRVAARAALGDGVKLERPFGVSLRAEPGGGALAAHAYSHSFCGMTLQYLLFWGMDSGLMLLRERRSGMWRRLRAAPVSRGTLLAGRALATALIALAQIVITLGFGAIVFGVTLSGSWLGFVLVALAAALLSSAVGLGVAALGGTEARARSVSILAILTLSLLGGLWLPSFLLPGWAQTLALLVPTTWAARGLEGVCWQGMGLTAAARCAAILTAFSAAFLALAWWRLVSTDGAQGDG